MKPLLQNLVEMTGHRDHLRLEVSVLSTLYHLPSVVQVRALEIFMLDGVHHVRPRTWMQDGTWESTETEPASDPQRQPLAHFPALQACIQTHSLQASAPRSQGLYRLWLPVWMGDQASICLEVTQSRPFSAHKLDVLIGIFSVYQNYQSLLDYSERDALTGLFNRKTFDEQFSRHTLTALEPRDPATPNPCAVPEGSIDPDARVQQWLAVIDIDHFKQVNDRFGHLYGDEVLILLANVLRTSFRSHDRIFRFGGEEFVVLLRSTNLATARKVFDRFRETVQNHPFPQVGQVTVSMGVVSTVAGSPVEILGKADQALYYAKENGRNQVRFYDDLLASGQLQERVTHEDMELF